MNTSWNRSAFFREKAEEIRRAAAPMTGSDNRAHLIRLADHYDAVAAHFERRESRQTASRAEADIPRG